MLFVGVDLAWSPRKTSAVSASFGDERGSSLREWRSDLVGAKAVAEFVEDVAGGRPALLAVDAPLVVPNLTGMRMCDKVITSLFRTHKAGVIPVNRSNLGRYDGFEGERLVAELVRRGYDHAVPLRGKAAVRGFFETYPHPASVVLFGLSERLPYKARGSKRPWRVRKKAYADYQQHLRNIRFAVPPMEIEESLLDQDLDGLSESQLKGYEDLLDSMLCAYMSSYYWTWGTARCHVVGSVVDGYMVLPSDRGGSGGER